MDVLSFSLRLPDGRSLEVNAAGPNQATPLVLHHGTPSDRTQYRPFAAAAAGRGLRLVSSSRPGYGTSPRQPGRTIADCAGDTLAIVEQLGAARCYPAGWSGGGPHALACAALLPGRVLACATIAGVGPSDTADLDFLAGRGQETTRSSVQPWLGRPTCKATWSAKPRHWHWPGSPGAGGGGAGRPRRTGRRRRAHR